MINRSKGMILYAVSIFLCLLPVYSQLAETQAEDAPVSPVKDFPDHTMISEVELSPGERHVTAKEPFAKATLHCIGIMWPVDGDSNGNASCTVQYRRAGTRKWHEAMPLHRKPFDAVDIENNKVGGRTVTMGRLKDWPAHVRKYGLDHWKLNYLAGSIFNLEPDTAYEVRLKLTDADGGLPVEKTLQVTTRAVPALPESGRKTEVRNAAALKAALEAAKAGDIVVLHAGRYQGAFEISASGTVDKPIVVRSAGDGAAVITSGSGACITITGSYVHLHELEIGDAEVAVRLEGRAKGIAVTYCRIFEVHNGVVGTGDDCYIADCVMVGNVGGGTEGEGVEIKGSGNVICYNRISGFADAASIYPNTSDTDFYNNDCFACCDDAIELDYCDHNNRVWNNLLYFAGNNGISFQPHIGGPAYIIRNQVMGFDENCLKDRYHSSDVYLFHNTFVGAQPRTRMRRGEEILTWPRPAAIPLRCFSRNNLYLLGSGTENPVFELQAIDLQIPCFDMDYEGLGGPAQIRKARDKAWREKFPTAKFESEDARFFIPIDAFSKAYKVLEHHVTVDPATLFEKPLPPWRDFWTPGPTPLMKLRAGAKAIDAGMRLPNLNDDFNGEAPDLGALEYDAPLPHWGPREK